jgi:hypothetical protein
VILGDTLEEVGATGDEVQVALLGGAREDLNLCLLEAGHEGFAHHSADCLETRVLFQSSCLFLPCAGACHDILEALEGDRRRVVGAKGGGNCGVELRVEGQRLVIAMCLVKRADTSLDHEPTLTRNVSFGEQACALCVVLDARQLPDELPVDLVKRNELRKESEDAIDRVKTLELDAP